MYTRGQFAIIGKTTRKALRIYEEKGILIPYKHDEMNDYRYYSNKQLDDLFMILKYKKLGFSLQEIKELLSADKDIKIDIFKKRLYKLNEEMSNSQNIKNILEEDINKQDNNLEKLNEVYDIRKSIFSERIVLFSKERIELQNLGVIIGKLMEKAAKNKLIPVGSHYICYDNFFDISEKIDCDVCLPVDRIEGIDNENIKIEPEIECISTVHRGGFSTTGRAHSALLKYSEKNSIKLSGKIFECYNKDMSVTLYYEILK
jgi:DNA-binding transcriptional MerR regulator